MRGSVPALFCLLLLVPLASAQEMPHHRPVPFQGQRAPAAEPTAQPARPRLKIGVALEGGGALGLAHVGVLQWFEDHHIPIDYLAGTSMGGLVGGFMPPAKVHNSFASWLKNRIGMSSWAGPFRMKTCRSEEKKTRSLSPTRLCWVCGEAW